MGETLKKVNKKILKNLTSPTPDMVEVNYLMEVRKRIVKEELGK